MSNVIQWHLFERQAGFIAWGCEPYKTACDRRVAIMQDGPGLGLYWRRVAALHHDQIESDMSAAGRSRGCFYDTREGERFEGESGSAIVDATAAAVDVMRRDLAAHARWHASPKQCGCSSCAIRYGRPMSEARA